MNPWFRLQKYPQVFQKIQKGKQKEKKTTQPAVTSVCRIGTHCSFFLLETFIAVCYWICVFEDRTRIPLVLKNKKPLVDRELFFFCQKMNSGILEMEENLRVLRKFLWNQGFIYERRFWKWIFSIQKTENLHLTVTKPAVQSREWTELVFELFP